jgi:hypothetical protein
VALLGRDPIPALARFHEVPGGARGARIQMREEHIGSRIVGPHLHGQLRFGRGRAQATRLLLHTGQSEVRRHRIETVLQRLPVQRARSLKIAAIPREFCERIASQFVDASRAGTELQKRFLSAHDLATAIPDLRQEPARALGSRTGLE